MPAEAAMLGSSSSMPCLRRPGQANPIPDWRFSRTASRNAIEAIDDYAFACQDRVEGRKASFLAAHGYLLAGARRDVRMPMRLDQAQNKWARGSGSKLPLTPAYVNKTGPTALSCCHLGISYMDQPLTTK
eukprot:TRINITY_DN24819_c0_g1_i1.p1 TRINITY_DN24819_c0_g1~~TRINITY_DN24819_c0_g1_i1.p1  ORF type:complete len:130 (-),score=22.78 TRINITY_DN24819_c0_g1_i1:29-418(-)